METMASRFALGAAKEQEINVVLKKAGDANIADLLDCEAIDIGSPEYFGTMAGMIKDFFDRAFEPAQDKQLASPLLSSCVLKMMLGTRAMTQIERVAAGYKWKMVLDHLRVVDTPTNKDLADVDELGQTLAAGVDFGIF